MILFSFDELFREEPAAELIEPLGSGIELSFPQRNGVDTLITHHLSG
jgi:hypothetical protein